MKQHLPNLLEELDRWQSPIPLDALCEQLEKTEVTFDDVRRVAVFGDRTYRRNLLHEGSAYHALVLCWRPGQRSPIHDHSGSACGVFVLKGTATETIFQRTPEGLIFATESRSLREGEVIGSFDADIHQISNLEPPGNGLVTLHIYSPPLIAMNLYSLTDTQIERFIEPIELFSDGGGI